MIAQRLRLVAALAVAALLAACNDTTVFRSNFDQSPVGGPPAGNQGVGTAQSGPAAQVRIAEAPGLPGRWVSIGRPHADTNVAAFQGRIDGAVVQGRYTVTTTLLIPETTQGVATVQFERLVQPFNDPSGFLHLDFLPNGKVRIDDLDSTTFGTYPRGQPFIVQVKLDTAAAQPTANILLSGAGAEGETDRAIAGPFVARSREFGVVRIWMGFPHLGEFKAANVVVKRARN